LTAGNLTKGQVPSGQVTSGPSCALPKGPVGFPGVPYGQQPTKWAIHRVGPVGSIFR
jgi:hypothetical protein